MVDNNETIKEYEKLKEQLYNKFNPNRDLYTEGKTKFVKKIVKKAKKKYKEIYQTINIRQYIEDGEN